MADDSSEPTPAGEGTPALDLGFLDTVAEERVAHRTRRQRGARLVSVGVTVAWLVAVTVLGHWGRTVDNAVASVTMVFGSFVAGSTPQGGGAVAFPVFTKGLEVPAEVARTFSLCIQTVGMGAASAAIILTRRTVERAAIVVGIPTAVCGFFAGLYLVGAPDEVFWPSTLPGPYVKVTFTLITAAMAFIVYLGTRVPLREVRTRIADPGPRQYVLLGVAGLIGGFASSLVGSGADILLYLFAVVLLGLEPRVAVPTSVLVMTAVSVVGFLTLGLADGQLAIDLAGDEVVAVGGEVLAAPLSATRADLFGLWIAAVPVVCWGAPLGSAFAARMSSRGLAVFAALLAAAEVITTVIFLEELRSNGALVAYALCGGAVLVTTLWLAARYRHVLAGVRLDIDRTLTRTGLDVAPGYRQALGGTTAGEDKERG